MLNYPFDQMAQGAVDMASANKQVTDLQEQFQHAMRNLLAAWRSQEGSPQMQQVQQLWTQANEEINMVLGRRSTALDDSWIGMKRADNVAANALDQV
ncbi:MULTISPECIES: hypothetical protein [Kribbella]|uniref:WXG100 family type VII secretion target n=1 Tax=Kribbella karoonensis TaxID=324851 RepID=A0ABP4QIN8_9ACTN